MCISSLMKIILGLLLSMVFLRCAQIPLNSGKNGSVNCGDITTSVSWRYCVSRTNNNLKDIIYYFHGGGGSEKSWASSKNYSALVRKLWKKRWIWLFESALPVLLARSSWRSVANDAGSIPHASHRRKWDLPSRLTVNTLTSNPSSASWNAALMDWFV